MVSLVHNEVCDYLSVCIWRAFTRRCGFHVVGMHALMPYKVEFSSRHVCPMCGFL